MRSSVATFYRIIFWVLATTLIPVSAMTADTNIAIVNGKAIRRSDLDRELQLIKLKMEREGRTISGAALNRYAGEIRETLIHRILLLEKAQAEGLTVGQREVAHALTVFKSGFNGEAAYHKALKSMGFTEAMLREQMKNGLTIKSLIDKVVVQRIVISDQTVRAFYDEHPDLFLQPETVRASHILIKVPENASNTKKSEALAAIQNLKKRIDAGEGFAALAMDHSDCPSKTKGGDLGYFNREQMEPSFTAAAFALETGQISDVVATPLGYHLIKVTDRKAAHTTAFIEVKEMISDRLRQEKEEKKIGKYLEKLKEHADIKRFPL